MNATNLNVGYVGMSHLGINSAVATAEKGTSVYCFDEDKKLIDDLNKLNINIDEPDLIEKLSLFKNRINFTTNVNDLNNCDLIFISKDVKTDENGNSDLSEVNNLIDIINNEINDDIILIILCQVPPGFTRKINRNKDYLYYQVETLIFGRAIERALNPERIILGCVNSEHKIKKNYREFLNLFECPIIPMVYESAELAKTAINIVLAAQVSTANSLAEICELSKGDWNEIIPALNLDKRIGFHAYLQTGLGISGGNIERDLSTVSRISTNLGGNNIFFNGIIEHSIYRKNWPWKIFQEKINVEVKRISILGLSYKVNTNSIKNSPSIDLIKKLKNYEITVFDPIIKTLPDYSNIKISVSLKEAVTDSDVLFIMVKCEEFKELNDLEFIQIIKKKSIIDPYRVIDTSKFQPHKHYVLGKN